MSDNKSLKPNLPCTSRRKFLKVLGGVSALSAMPTKGFANIQQTRELGLSLLNLHTGESLESTFYSDGIYHNESLNDLNFLLRDHRNNQIHQIDTKLLRLLHDLQQQFGQHKPLHIISAYRSPESNAKLRANNKKVAKKSYHMKGQAIDIRIPGVPLKELHRASLTKKAGGVGLYTKSDFIHLDVGRVRSWGA